MPQGIVDVRKAADICQAENTTGHPFSLCISESDRRTFVKGTFPEEIKWWMNELCSFVKPKVRKYKVILELNLKLCMYVLQDRLRNDTFYRDKRTPLYFQHTPASTYGDVVDFGK